MGLVLMLILACPLVRGQDQKTEGTPSRETPEAPLPPITPAEPIEGAGPKSREVSPALGIPPVGEQPAPEAATGDAAGERKDSPRARLVSPPRDADLRKAQATADTGASAPVATPPVQAAVPPATTEGNVDGQGFVLPADRLPLGKQDVNLSVEVQAPANLIFNRDATFKIIVRNSSTTDAVGVVVRDELPPGLSYINAQPEAQRTGESLLSWRISTLPAGSERIIILKGRPTKESGALDHAATVSFQAGSKATSRVLRPRLKLEVVQTPSEGKVLKNKTAEFRIAVTNTGDGPARNVTIQAKLSPGLRHETGERNEDNSFELPIQELGPGQREDLDPLNVDALQGGEQWCRITATSTDVDLDKDAAQVERKLEVVAPQLKMTLAGPDKRFTDTVASYAITLENPGTAPAKNVKIMATLGVSGRLVAVPPGAKYDSASRRLQWTIPQIDPNEKGKSLAFEVRMGGISAYEINIQARGDNGLDVKDRKITDVQGMADVDLVVREKRRVVDVDGTTTFQIRLRNYGTKEATKLQVEAKLSNNLFAEEVAGGPEEVFRSEAGDEVKWGIIDRLGPGKEMTMSIKVKVTKPQPKIGTCRIFLLHDDLTEKLEDMAGVKITESRRAISVGP
jgi:uncharacterized repeat protein (TIGR01451 family)